MEPLKPSERQAYVDGLYRKLFPLVDTARYLADIEGPDADNVKSLVPAILKLRKEIAAVEEMTDDEFKQHKAKPSH